MNSYALRKLLRIGQSGQWRLVDIQWRLDRSIRFGFFFSPDFHVRAISAGLQRKPFQLPPLNNFLPFIMYTWKCPTSRRFRMTVRYRKGGEGLVKRGMGRNKFRNSNSSWHYTRRYSPLHRLFVTRSRSACIISWPIAISQTVLLMWTLAT